MPSTDDIQAQNSKGDKDCSDQNEINESEICTDHESTSGLSASSPKRSVKGFGLSNKIKSETRKLFGYPGKAMKMKRSASYEVYNFDDKQSENLAEGRRVDEDFSSYFKEHDLLMEFKYLCKNPPSGVYVIPSIKSLQVWHGIIFLRAGPFHEGIFRFDILFQDNFPNAVPLIRFTSQVFHPQVHKNGILNIEQAFPCWKKENHIGDVLKYVKSCFYTMNTYGPLNEEAANCLNENLEDFKRRARLCVEKSVEEFNRESPITSEDDGNLLKVKTFSALAIDEWKQQILNKDQLDANAL